ncbi:MAG: PfkB family carbohydrate kinase [Candidatus Zixiibacteriota bacterium]
MSSSKKIEFDCLGFGVCPIDHLCVLESYPQLDDKIEALESDIQGGGPVPTAMATLSRLGKKVIFMGRVGNDPDGEFVRNQLQREGVNTDYLIVDPEMKTPKAFIWIDKKTGKRTVVLDQPELKRTKPSELKFLDNIKVKFLHLDARDIDINLYLAEWAKNMGADVILDMGSLRGDFKKLLPLVDYLVVSRRFASGYTKLNYPLKACRKLMGEGFKIVVITLGEKGAVVSDGGTVFRVPGYKVNVVDTTGAGDVFHGAFIYGLCQKWELKKTIQFSNACAALKCTKLGGRTGIPALAEVENFLKAYPET